MTPQLNVAKPKLVFVYLGRNFPDYAKASLELVSISNDVDIVLIANHFVEKRTCKINLDFISVEDFYDKSIFSTMYNSNINSSIFRDGFWLRTLERFFVLQQFMEVSSESNIIHAELDQLLFRIDELSRNLVKANFSEIALPFHLPGIAVASVVFISDASMLTNFVNFSLARKFFDNEMTLLGTWAQNSALVQAFPTLSSLKNSNYYQSKIGVPLIDEKITQGYVDPAQIGQWAGGIDPRNVPLRSIPVNKYVDASRELLLEESDLSQMVFSFDSNEGYLSVDSGEASPVRLYNIHLHSKIHKLFSNELLSFQSFFDVANKVTPHHFPIARRMQVTAWILERWALFSAHPLKSMSSLLRRLLN